MSEFPALEYYLSTNSLLRVENSKKTTLAEEENSKKTTLAEEEIKNNYK